MPEIIRDSDIAAPFTLDDTRRLGRRVAEHREKRGWKQIELSRRTGIGPTRVSRIERGTVDPRVSELVRIHRALGVSITGLLFGDRDAAEIDSRHETLGSALRKATPREDREAVQRLLKALLAGYEHDLPDEAPSGGER